MRPVTSTLASRSRIRAAVPWVESHLRFSAHRCGLLAVHQWCCTRFKGRSGQSKEGLGTVLPGLRLAPESRPRPSGTTRVRYRLTTRRVPIPINVLSMRVDDPVLRAGAVVCSGVGDGRHPVQSRCQDTPGRRFGRRSGGRQGPRGRGPVRDDLARISWRVRTPDPGDHDLQLRARTPLVQDCTLHSCAW